MKKLFVLALISFLFVAQAVYAAKTVTIVTSGDTDSTCSDLNEDGLVADAVYCYRISNLGYSYKVINEDDIIYNSQRWKDYAYASSMIFIGNVSLKTVNTSEYREAFCNGLLSISFPKLAFFFTPPHTTRNYVSGNLRLDGCAFKSNFGFFWPPPPYIWSTNNTFTQKKFKILESGIVTEDYSVGDLVELYSSSGHLIDISNKSNSQWVGMDASPDPYEPGYYPTISSRKIPLASFWGLRDPQDFTNAAWNLFDRFVIDAMGDSYWKVYSSMSGTLPQSLITTNGSMIIWANVTDYLGRNPSDAVANFTLTYGTKQIKGGMAFENGLWKNSTTKLPIDSVYTLQISAYSTKFLRGQFTGEPIAGNITIDMTTSKDNYQPNSNYLINISLWIGKNPFTDSSTVNYRILNSKTYAVLQQGNLGKRSSSTSENFYNKTIANIPDYDNFILEVTAISSGIGGGESGKGGNFKTVTKLIPSANLVLTTDKENYKPNQDVTISLESDSPPDELPKLSLYKPNGQLLFPDPVDMTQIDPTHWKTEYSLGDDVPNGVFTAHVKFKKEGQTYTVNKTFSVTAWKLNVDTDDLEYNASDDVEITVSTTEAYKSTIKVDINISIVYPNSTEFFFDGDTLRGNDTYEDSYTLPYNAPTGRYFVKVYANDTAGREDTKEADFLVGMESEPSQELIASPSTWSAVTIEGRLIHKNFTLSNLGTTTASNINVNIPSQLSGIVSVVSVPTSITGGDSGPLKLLANTDNQDEGVKSGSIRVLSSIGNATISTSITIVGDLAARADELLEELQSLLPDITKLEEQGRDVSDIRDLYDDTETLLDKAKNDYLSEDYSSSLSNINEAESNIDQLRSDITAMLTAPSDAGLIIWGVATVIVVAIIGITVWKFRKKIFGLFKKGGEEEEVEEVYTKPEGEYRTEYY